MALANNAPVNTRAIKDVNYVVSVALPNAANTVNTSGLNLIQAVPYPITEYVIAQITNSPVGNGANNKNINVVLQDSADNSNWTNVALFANPIVQFIDNNGAGAPANYANVLLPPGIRQYIRAQATGEANGGNAANGSLVLQLLF